MTFDIAFLLAATLLYLLLLFIIAYATDHGWIGERIVRHPLVYTLSLGVYTTSWSYYGSVGFAEQQGLLFLTVYIGPTLAFLLAPVLLAPLLRLTRDFQLTSVADLFAFRYSSQLVGVLVTLFMLFGTLPYIALQIRAVSESTRILTGGDTAIDMGLAFCITLTIFAILFGARHVSPREKHAGMVLAIAFESLIKLAAIIAVGAFALFGIFDGPSDLDRWLQSHPEAIDALYRPVSEGPWFTLILLSFAAAFLLPRQFHMAFVENLDSRSLHLAAWAFPLFLLLFNLAIPPILWAGQTMQASTGADYYVLGITRFANNAWLPTIAYIGGISAASAMTIVTALALSQMALNHILLPASYPDPAVDLYLWLLWGRRMLIAMIIVTSYGLYLILESNEGLVQLGLVSFVAVIQFLPGIAGILFWRRATKVGFLAGLITGGLVWYTTLVMPMLGESGIILLHFDFREFMGRETENIWQFTTFWSLSLNTILFLTISLITRQDAGEQRAVAACFQDGGLTPGNRLVTANSPLEFSEQLSRIIGSPAGENEVKKALADLDMNADERRPLQLQQLRERIERNLSGMLGPMLARLIVDSRLQEDETARSMLVDHMRFIEERLEQSHSRLRGLAAELDGLRRYHRQILQDLPLGACSLSAEGAILSWNQALEQLTGIERNTAIGFAVGELMEPWCQLFNDFLAQEQQHAHKIRVTVEDRPRWFNLHKAAVAYSLQAPEAVGEDTSFGVVVLVEDVSEVQVLEAELVHSERLASIGRLAAGVAHEIGNPITGIACIAQNLRYEEEPEIIEQSLEDILTQTERISTIVQTLITYSHGGRMEGQRFTRVTLGECITEAQRLVKLSHQAKQITHVNQCDKALELDGDRQRLLQVFVNLLSNACDASEPGDRVEIEAHYEDAAVMITVSDQGTGIPEALRERVFEPFFTTKDPGKGTGLGLPLVYSIIRDHGGSITIDSAPGQGTRFLIRLPRQQTQKAATQPTAVH